LSGNLGDSVAVRGWKLRSAVKRGSKIFEDFLKLRSAVLGIAIETHQYPSRKQAIKHLYEIQIQQTI